MTEPLTPADCDLRDFAFMPLDAARLLDSDLFALSTGDEFKAALALWCKSWVQVPAGSLPDDDRVLAHLSGAGSKWKKVKDMALRGFVKCDDGRLYHTIVCEKANEAWSKKQSYRDRSKKGNAKRWGSQKDGVEQSKSDPSGTPSGTGEAVLEPPKGEGEGQREGEGKTPSGQKAETDYAFCGEVVRLNKRDYDNWRERFSRIADFDAELTALDSWLTGQPEAKRKNWFGSCAPWLNRRHQDAMQRVNADPMDGFVT
jgi:hypothetical protein